MLALLCNVLLFLGKTEAFTLDSVFIQAEKGIGSNRSVFIPPGEEYAGSLAMGVSGHAGPAYSRTLVDSFHTTNQFRYVSLSQELGFNFYKKVELYIQHKSEHGLDQTTSFDFPTSNSVGVRVFLYGGK